MSKQLYFKPSNTNEAEKNLSLRGLTLNNIKKAFMSLSKFKGRLKNKKIKTVDIRQAIGDHFGDKKIDKQGLEQFFEGYCKEKEIQLEKNDLTKMLGCFEKEWDGCYKPDQLIVNLVNYTYEDFLAKRYMRHNPKPYSNQQDTNIDNPNYYTREAVASKMVAFHHISGDANAADILSKHWGHTQVYPMLRPLLFYRGNTLDLIELKEDSDATGQA